MGSERRVLFYDVETSPSLAFVWNARTEYISEQMMEDGPPVLFTWAAKWRGEDTIYSRRLTKKQAIEQDDRDMVASLAALMRRADLVCGHNVDKFDTKMVRTRLALMDEEPLGPIQSIDTLRWSKASFKLPYNSLDYLGQRFVGEGKKAHIGFEMWRRCYFGDAQALRDMEEYNRADVVLNEKVFEAMLPHAVGVPRLALSNGDECPHCARGKREDGTLIYKGVWPSAVHTYQRVYCKVCRRYGKGRRSLTPIEGGPRPMYAPIR